MKLAMLVVGKEIYLIYDLVENRHHTMWMGVWTDTIVGHIVASLVN